MKRFKSVSLLVLALTIVITMQLSSCGTGVDFGAKKFNLTGGAS